MRRIAAALACGALLLAVPLVAAGGPPNHDAPSPPDSVAADPFLQYLESLGQDSDSSFSGYSLEKLPISGGQIDSLVGIYEETGEVPDISTVSDHKWRLSPGLAAVRYNRVEGLNVMPELTAHLPTQRRIEAFGGVGYATASREVTWQAGCRAQVMQGGGGPILEAEYAHDLRRYGSGGMMGNSITAILAGGDYEDYFLGEGWKIGVRTRPRPYQFDVAYRVEDQDSLANEAPFHFFRGDGAFLPNPPIDPGRVRCVELGVAANDLPIGLASGAAQVTVAGNGLGGDFDYETWEAGLAATRKLWFGDLLVARASGGGVAGDAPFQALHHLGGFRTLRGYRVNEIPARQFAHLSLDYEIGTNLLRGVPMLGGLKIQAVPFCDGAAIFQTQERDGTVVDLDDPEWRFAAGLGLQKNFLGIPGRSGWLRIDITRRLDRGEDAFTCRAQITVERL